MSRLTALEMAAATLIAEQIGIGGPKALIDQLKTAEVSTRDFTGLGFFTEFVVDRTLPRAEVTASPGGWVQSRVGPRAYPLELMLYVKDGFVEMIEAYSFEEGYGDIDLLTAEFTEPKKQNFDDWANDSRPAG